MHQHPLCPLAETYFFVFKRKKQEQKRKREARLLPLLRISAMGRRLRFLPALGFAAAVAIAGVRVNAAAGYAHVQREQKPISGIDSAAGGNPLTPEFGEFVREQLEKWKVPGVAVAVIDGDEVYAEGYGYATLPDVPATPETLWYGASTTKAHVAAALSALIHSGNYSALSQGWSTPISSIIRDDFVLQDEWATNHVTLDDAVSHRTGMARHDGSSVREIDGRPATPRDVVRNLRNLPLTAEPRVTVYYCNLMYVTLSHVIETITGKWLGRVLRDLLWEPLGMNSTYFDLQSALDAPEHMASGYAWDQEKGEFKEIPFMTVTEVSGAGSVISNALDYAKWIKSLIHRSGPLSRHVHEDIRTPRMFWPGSPEKGYDLQLYGLGWVRTLHKGHVVYTHSGGMHAYGAEVYWFPEAMYGVVVFGNTATCHVVEEIVGWKLIDDKLGIPAKDRFDYGSKWKKAEAKLDWLYKNALDILYPERPNPALPSTLSTSELVGTYYNAGYGNITLREEPHPDKLGEKILVADRPDSTWRYSMHFHHVSGDNWIVYLPAPIYSGTNFVEFVAGEFKLGADGKASGIEIIWESRTDPMFEGIALYKRIA
ncbi:beta-lactamase/transpeptidase-like protein [Trichoderma barbatum]